MTYHNIWNFIESIEIVDDRTVKVNVSEARHQEWDNALYWNQIVPEHVFSAYSEE